MNHAGQKGGVLGMSLLKKILIAWILSLFCLSAQGDLRFLLPPVSSPAVMYAAFTPLAQYLSRVSGETVHLSFSGNLRSFYLEANKPVAQIALFCPISYLRVAHESPYLPLVGIDGGPGSNHSVILVRADSPVHSVLQLRGKSFVMGDPACAASALLPLSLLSSVGIGTKDFSTLRQSGSDQSALMDVAARFYDATAVAENVAMPYIREGTLRVVARMDVGPGDLIAASAEVPPALREKLRTALLETARADPAALHALGGLARGFHPLTDGAYAPLRALYRDLYGAHLDPKYRSRHLVLGIPPAFSPVTAARLFAPLLQALREATGEPVVVLIPPSETDYVRDLRAGRYSFALLSPLMQQAAKDRLQVLARLDPPDTDKGLAVVSLLHAPATPEVAAREGLTIAYSSPYCSAAGILRPWIKEHAHGRTLHWLGVSSERAVFAALATHKADWGVLRAATVKNLMRETPDTWRVLTMVGPAPAWVLTSGAALRGDQLAKIRQALAAIPTQELQAAGFARIRPVS
ncbi:MAG: PhnD/SsuA/transferrin family substrate-binding protein [Acidithiobacillus sp.]